MVELGLGECHLAPKTVLHSVEWGTGVGECVFEIALTCGGPTLGIVG